MSADLATVAGRGRTAQQIVAAALAAEPTECRALADPPVKDGAYEPRSRPLLAHVDEEQVRALMIERLVWRWLHLALAPLRRVSAAVSADRRRRCA